MIACNVTALVYPHVGKRLTVYNSLFKNKLYELTTSTNGLATVPSDPPPRIAQKVTVYGDVEIHRDPPESQQRQPQHSSGPPAGSPGYFKPFTNGLSSGTAPCSPHSTWLGRTRSSSMVCQTFVANPARASRSI